MSEENEEQQGFDALLTDSEEREEGVEYVVPKYIETKLSKDKKLECRGIVRTINQFGVSQRQKLFLIYLLALELENRDSMLKIVKAVAESKDSVEDAPTIDTSAAQGRESLVLSIDAPSTKKLITS